MMPTLEMLPIAAVAVDVFLIVLVGVLLHRLAKDPTREWKRREEGLAALHDSLRLLVSQAEGQARTLDADLAAHTDRLQRLLEQSAEVHPPRAASMAPGAAVAEPVPGSLSSRVKTLARSGVEPEEIAQEMGIPLADVRLLVGLGRSERGRADVAYAGRQG